jgi:hypothetical protein
VIKRVCEREIDRKENKRDRKKGKEKKTGRGR